MSNNNSFQVNLYKLYVLCLPFGRFIDLGLSDFLSKVFVQFSTLLMTIGVVCLIGNKLFYSNRRTNLFKTLCAFMVVWSLIASSILSVFVDSNLKSPFVTMLAPICFNILAVFSIFYNYYCLTHFVPFNKLYKIFDIQIVVLLLVGYLQIAAIAGFSAPYEALRSVFALQETAFLVAVNRGITLFGNEPSSVAIITFCVLPYVFTSISNTKGLNRYKYICFAVLFFILFLGSGSTQTLILFFAATGLYAWYIWKKSIPAIFFKLSFIVGMGLSCLQLVDKVESISVTGEKDSFEYALLAKALDRENYSTAIRFSTVINDLKIVKDYPLTGVGDGNQGYFYFDNIPDWVAVTPGAQTFMEEKTIVNGGGNFFPTFFSAYGLIGVFFLLSFLKKYKYLYKTSFLQNNYRADVLFKIGIILFIFSSWSVVALRETHIFLLSLACVESDSYKTSI